MREYFNSTLFRGMILIGIIGVVISYFAFTTVERYEDNKTSLMVEKQAKRYLSSVYLGIERQIDIINFIEAFYIGSSYVSKNEFRMFVTQSIKRNSTVHWLGWAPYIKEDSLSGLKSLALKEGVQDYTIFRRDKQGRKREQALQNSYLPLLYVEPYTQNRDDVGYDIFSHRELKKSALVAKSNGKTILGDKIKTFHNGGWEELYIITKAVYDQKLPVSTPSERDKAFRGLVIGEFHFEDLIKNALGDDDNYFNVKVEKEVHGRSNIIYDYYRDNKDKASKKMLNSHSWSSTVEIEGSLWNIIFTPTKNYIDELDGDTSIGVLFFSLFMTMLLVWYLYKKGKEREHLEYYVLERTQELQVASRVKSEFLANMSHEIRTPLNGVIGFIDLLYKDEKDPTKRKRMSTVKESGNTLMNIINDILDYSKIESKKVEIDLQPTDISKLFEQSVELFFPNAKEKNLELKLNIDKNVPEYVLADRLRLKQIFSNLLSNAIKFSPTEGMVTVTVAYDISSKTLRCEVLDQGDGIDIKVQKRIFNAFEQADISTTRKFGGTGLGLPISKALVALMGGELYVESTVGKGSLFYFVIPVQESTIEEESSCELEGLPQKFQGKVLVAEDNQTNQMLMKILLDDFGLESVIVENGALAVEQVQKEHFDLILMDENMPVLNGSEATLQIRKLPNFAALPIVAVTANALKGDKEYFLACGMNDYISKPIEVNDLHRILVSYCKCLDTNLP